MKAFTRLVVRLAAVTLGFAGLIVAAGAVPASATPSIGNIVSTILARGTYASHGSLHFEHGLQVVVNTATLAPGSSTGWHSHPGGEIIVITQGQLTFYQSAEGENSTDGNPCQITTYTAGQSFINRARVVHDAVNTGSVPAIAYVILPDVPVGGSPRIDAPDPGTCPGI